MSTGHAAAQGLAHSTYADEAVFLIHQDLSTSPVAQDPTTPRNTTVAALPHNQLLALPTSKVTSVLALSMKSRNSKSARKETRKHDAKEPSRSLRAKPLASPSTGDMASTIRPVRSSEEKENDPEDASSDASRSTAPALASSESIFSSSVNSNASRLSAASKHSQAAWDPRQPNPRAEALSSVAPALKPKIGETWASDFTAATPAVPSDPIGSPVLIVDVPRRESSRSANVSIAPPQSALAAQSAGDMGSASGVADLGAENSGAHSLGSTEPQLSNAWDAAVGKAGLGKTGRVINRLVSDNEALKRDIQIEKLRAEESRQAARLVEDKMERLVSDFEGRLLEANVTKTLLARKERQVESLQAAVEAERRRATEARDGERLWKEEMEKLRVDAKRQVDEAVTHAALMEGRYNAISSHWRDQGDEVQRTVRKMGKQIAELNDERRADDDRIATLRDLCDQQDGNIRDLRRQKDDITQRFDAYRVEQEEALRDIKDKAMSREAEQEMFLKEAKEMLDKLKWALAVKEKIPWAQ